MKLSDEAQVSFDELLEYWLDELPQARAEAIEERLFEDEALAWKLETVAQVGAAVGELVRAGQLQHVLAGSDLAQLETRGVRIRQYSVEPGATVPCGIDREDFVAIRLRSVVRASDQVGRERVERIDIEMRAFPEGGEPLTERYADVPFDRRGREVVLMFPGDRIRALPATRVDYRVFGESAAGRRLLGEYHLEHRT